MNGGALTLLDELKPIFNVALVTHEKEASIFNGSIFLHLLIRNLGPILDASTDDTTGCGSAKSRKIASRVRFANMCCERASVLAALIVRILEGIGEIVVPGRIWTKNGIVSERCDVERSSYTVYRQHTSSNRAWTQQQMDLLTTWPSANQSCSQEISASWIVWSRWYGQGVRSHERIKFRNMLREFAKREKAAISGP